MNSRVLTAVAVSVMTIAGCTTVTTNGPEGQPISRTHDEFRTYGESVFGLQNAVLDQLISAADVNPEPFALDAAALLAAEERLVDSCRD